MMNFSASQSMPFPRDEEGEDGRVSPSGELTRRNRSEIGTSAAQGEHPLPEVQPRFVNYPVGSNMANTTVAPRPLRPGSGSSDLENELKMRLAISPGSLDPDFRADLDEVESFGLLSAASITSVSSTSSHRQGSFGSQQRRRKAFNQGSIADEVKTDPEQPDLRSMRKPQASSMSSSRGSGTMRRVQDTKRSSPGVPRANTNEKPPRIELPRRPSPTSSGPPNTSPQSLPLTQHTLSAATSGKSRDSRERDRLGSEGTSKYERHSGKLHPTVTRKGSSSGLGQGSSGRSQEDANSSQSSLGSFGKTSSAPVVSSTRNRSRFPRLTGPLRSGRPDSLSGSTDSNPSSPSGSFDSGLTGGLFRRKLSGDDGGRHARSQSRDLEAIGSGSSSPPHVAPIVSFEKDFDDQDAPDEARRRLSQTVRRARDGNTSLTEVLDAMFNLSSRLTGEETDALYRYLALGPTLEVAVKALVRDDSPSAESSIHVMNVRDRRVSNPYHYVLVNMFASGPASIRKSLLSCVKARNELLSFFERDHPRPPTYNDDDWQFRLHGIGRVLSSLLRESPAEMADCISNRKGFLQALVLNYMSVGTVSDFLVELCAADPLSTLEPGAELRYGSANATGIVLLMKENIPSQIVELFETCLNDTLLGGMHQGRRRETVEMCLRCIHELGRRALLTPTFDKSNCSYNKWFIQKLNNSLSQLNAVESPKCLDRMLKLSLGALFGEPGDRGVSCVGTLEVILDLLESVRMGCKSKLMSTRMTMRKVSTQSLENVVLDQLQVLTRLMNLEEGRSGSLQRLRLTIARVLAFLFGSANTSTLLTLAEHDLPVVMIQLISRMPLCSVVHSIIAEAFGYSFAVSEAAGQSPDEGLKATRKAWIGAIDRTSPLLYDVLLEEYGDKGCCRKRTPQAATYVRLGQVLRAYHKTKAGRKELEQTMHPDALRSLGQVCARVLDDMARDEGVPLAGPKPDRTTASLLASPASLAALSLDNIDSIDNLK